MNLEYFIQRPRSVALEIEGDIPKAKRFDRRHDSTGHRGFERPRKLTRIDFDASELSVVPQTKLPESEIAKRLLPLFDLTEALDRHFGAVGQS